MPPKRPTTNTSSSASVSPSAFAEIKKEINVLFPADTLSIFFNIVAAAVLMFGGLIGFLSKGSKMSLVVSFIFGLAWLYTAFTLRKNTGKKLEIRVKKLMSKMSKDTEWFLRNVIDVKGTEKNIFRAYLNASISSAALCALMCIRVFVLNVEITTPILVIIGTASVVFMINTQKVLMMKM